jgi:hypothetical protein
MPFGGVPEWLNGAVSKTVRGPWVPRGFESHPLRLQSQIPRKWVVLALLRLARLTARNR